MNTRARSGRQIPTLLIPNFIQTALVAEIGEDATISRDVTIGAMYRDDLPISGHEYSNVFIVVSWGMTADILFPGDPNINVEMYFGLNSTYGDLKKMYVIARISLDKDAIVVDVDALNAWIRILKKELRGLVDWQ